MKISAKALFAMAFYILIPAVGIVMVMARYPELSESMFIDILVRIIPIGFVLMIICQYQTGYEKGTKEHLWLDVAYTITAMLWVLAFLGGSPVVTQEWNGHEFSIIMWKKLAIVFAVAMVNLAYYWMVYEVHATGGPLSRLRRLSIT